LACFLAFSISARESFLVFSAKSFFFLASSLAFLAISSAYFASALAA